MACLAGRGPPASIFTDEDEGWMLLVAAMAQASLDSLVVKNRIFFAARALDFLVSCGRVARHYCGASFLEARLGSAGILHRRMLECL